MTHTDIAIVGAGPAGSICAIELQRGGRDCLLIDRAEFPREKLCGGGLTPHTWQLLERLLPDLQYDYVPVYDMRLELEGQYKGTYRLRQPVRIVQRRVFDGLLVDEYKRLGGRFLHETLAGIEETAEGFVLTMRSGAQVQCREIVGADGSNSRVRHFLSPVCENKILCVEQYEPYTEADREAATGEIARHITIEISRDYEAGYFYEYPNRHEKAVGYGERHTSVDKFRQILSRHGYTPGQIKGAMISFDRNVPQHPHILLIGDAGGYVDDLSAEGIYYAMATGHNAAQALLTGQDYEVLNAAVNRKKRHKALEARFVHSRLGHFLLGIVCHHKGFVEAVLNRYMV